MTELDNIPEDYLGSDYTCLSKEEQGPLIDCVDDEEIYLGAEIIMVNGDVFKACNLLSYMRLQHPEIFSIYEGGK